MKKKVDGFTLIELVIVIAILAILIAIAVPKFQQSNLKAKVTAHNSNVRVIKNAAILYSADHVEAKAIEIKDLSDYLDTSKDLKPMEGKGEKFTILVDEGDISVKPGMLEIIDGQVKEVQP